jgi:hypothetical protein
MPEDDPKFDISRICVWYGHTLELPQIVNRWGVQAFIMCSGHSQSRRHAVSRRPCREQPRLVPSG